MSAIVNTTPIVTTVTKPATNPRDADATPRVNIQDLYEEYYEDILPIIMDKVRHDKRKDIHARLDFGEGSRERRTREDFNHSSARARTTKPERLKVRDRLRYGDRHVLDRLDSRDHPRGRSRPRRLDTSNEDCPEDRERFRGVGESYDDSYSHSYHDGNRSRHMKRRMENESTLSIVSKSDSSDGRVWFDELSPESVDSYKDIKAAFIAYFMQQKKYVKDPVEIHNIKQKDGETIEDFMERFKVETGRMKGAPECMRISRFMHGVNNPELTKCLIEHVPKTMEEMMITTTAFIRGEAASASKKKGHASWRAQDQTSKEILATEAGKFQSPPPMVTPVEKRISNKFCDFHNDKGHSTDECMQLKKQIEEFVRAGKLSYLIKEIKHGRDQSKTGKKEIPAKDKPASIYMIQSWKRMTRQKVTQSFERVREITFPPLTANSEAPQWKYSMNTASTGSSLKSRTNGPGDYIANWSLSPYNGIIGRPGIREIQAVPSTAHRMLKFPVEGGIVTIRSTILIPAECTLVITSSAVPKKEETHPENFKVALHPDFPDQEVAIEGTLSVKGRTKLCSILKKNLDIFAWQPSDMIGVSRSVAEHQLNIREGYSPVRQKKRGQAPERAKAIQAEVQKLVEAGIMREVYYHDWLSDPVMVKKHNSSWWMCVDFTDLNKACPQDCYPIQKSTGKLNLSAATLSSVSWMLTKATTRYSWQNRMKRKQLSTLAKGCIATQKCLSASRTLAPRTIGWWTKLSTAKLVGT
nr:reverse transcriptase domain-containing protein [Tanacetum cinerariifolium]